MHLILVLTPNKNILLCFCALSPFYKFSITSANYKFTITFEDINRFSSKCVLRKFCHRAPPKGQSKEMGLKPFLICRISTAIRPTTLH